MKCRDSLIWLILLNFLDLYKILTLITRERTQ